MNRRLWDTRLNQDNETNFSDESSNYMQQGKFFEAYGMLERQYKLGHQLHFAPVLVKYYVSLMQTDEGERADKIRDELIAVLEEKYGDSPDEVRRYADHLRHQCAHFEAVLFYQIALHFADKYRKKLVNVSDMTQHCACGLLSCITRLHEENHSRNKLLRQYVMTWILKAQKLIPKVCANDKKLSVLAQSCILKFLAWSQFLIHDVQDCEITLKKSISNLENSDSINAQDFSMYAEQLCLLGSTYHLMDRGDDSTKYLKKAIAAAKKLKDLGAGERTAVVRKYEELLKKFQDN